jgi:phospholipase C
MAGSSLARRRAAAAAIVALLATACTASSSVTSGSGNAAESGIHKIRHVVIIMQENRSFDSYFGTHPGADGIPAKDGHFTVRVPDPRTGGWTSPITTRAWSMAAPGIASVMPSLTSTEAK